MQQFSRIIFSFSLCLVITLVDAKADIKGSCEQDSFNSLKNFGEDIRTFHVLRHNAPIFASEDTNEITGKLEFDTFINATAVTDIRIQFISTNRQQKGWVERADVLCRITPLRQYGGDHGIERKFFTRPPVGDSKSSLSLSPQTVDCKGRGCPSFERFELFFIYAQVANKVLLATSYEIEGEKPLFGWATLNQDGFEWNTSIGVQPEDKINKPLLAWTNIADAVRARDRNAFLFQSDDLEDIPNSAFIIPSNKNRSWYGNKMRLAVVDIVNAKGDPVNSFDKQATQKGFYKLVSTVQRETREVQQYKDTAKGEAEIRRLAHADIMFLIDGTASMNRYIHKVKDTAISISQNTGKKNHLNSDYRFGFQVYRDSYADSYPGLNCHEGVCEGFKFSDQNDCKADADDVHDLVGALNDVEATVNDKDYGDQDAEEQLWQGMNSAIIELTRTCQERAKILIVIGDMGDRNSSIPSAIKGRIAQGNIDVYAIQTRLTNSPTAHKAFKTQMQSVIRYALGQASEVPASKLFYSLSELDMSRKIDQFVATITGSGVLEVAVEHLRAGDLNKMLDREKTKALQRLDAPLALLYEKIQAAACRNAGTRQCTLSEGLGRDVKIMYYPVNAKYMEELVWMHDDDLINYKSAMESVPKKLQTGEQGVRSALKDAIATICEAMVGYPPVTDFSSVAIGQYIAEHSAIPISRKSPLMQYTSDDLDAMVACEIQTWIVPWVRDSLRQLKEITLEPSYFSRYTKQKTTGTQQCLPSNLTKEKTLSITRLRKNHNNPARPLAPDNIKLGDQRSYSYQQEFRNLRMWWLPASFFP